LNDLREVIRKHRGNGLLLDSNLCILYLVGKTNERRIGRFDRTQQYTVAEFRLLSRIVDQFPAVVTTPHILTEVSNLARLREPELGILRAILHRLAERSQEVYLASELVIADRAFPRLGLTDAAILMAAATGCLVLTADLNLHTELTGRGLFTINFNHIRTFTW
jgi:hypothetical protein